MVSHGVDRELSRDAMGRSDPEKVSALRHLYKTTMEIVLYLYLTELLVKLTLIIYMRGKLIRNMILVSGSIDCKRSACDVARVHDTVMSHMQ